MNTNNESDSKSAMESERQDRLDRILEKYIENNEGLNLQMLQYDHTMMFEQAFMDEDEESSSDSDFEKVLVAAFMDEAEALIREQRRETYHASRGPLEDGLIQREGRVARRRGERRKKGRRGGWERETRKKGRER